MVTFKLNIPPGGILGGLDNSDKFNHILQVASIATAKELEAEARPYPGPSSSPVTWQSRQQQAAYFAMRRAQGLTPNYTRQSDAMSERLIESWVVEPYGVASAVLKNSATYAPYVIGDEQYEQHRLTGWRKLGDVAKEFFASGRAMNAFEKVFYQLMRMK
jgi:hypothetical protein